MKNIAKVLYLSTVVLLSFITIAQIIKGKYDYIIINTALIFSNLGMFLTEKK